MFLRIFFFLSILGFVFGCKPMGDQGSESKSLDQLAGSSALHQCKGKYEDNDYYLKLVKGQSGGQTKALDDALSAMPKEIKDQFFVHMKGEVQLVSNVAEKCIGSQMAKVFAKRISPHRLD